MQAFNSEKNLFRDKGNNDSFPSTYQRTRKRSNTLTQRDIPLNMGKENIDKTSGVEIPRNNLRRFARAASQSPADLPDIPSPPTHSFGTFSRLSIESQPQSIGETTGGEEIYKRKEVTKPRLGIRSRKGALLENIKEDSTFIGRTMREYEYNGLPKPYQSPVNNLISPLTRNNVRGSLDEKTVKSSGSNNRLALMAQLEKMRSEDEASSREIVHLCDQLEQIRRSDSPDDENVIVENDQIKNTYPNVGPIAESTTLKKKSFFWKLLCQIILFIVLVAELLLLWIFRGLSETRQEFYIQKIAPDLQIQTQEAFKETVWEQMIRSARVAIIETMGWTPGWSNVGIPS